MALAFINNTQRKVLEKIYLNRINDKETEFTQKINEEEDERAKEIAMRNPKFKKLQKEHDDAAKRKTEAEQTQEKIREEIKGQKDFEMDYSNNYQITAKSSHPEIKEFRAEKEKRREKFSALKTEILSEIWGLQASYTELSKLIEEKLAKL